MRCWNRPPTHQKKLDLAIVGKGLQIQAETKSGQVVVRRGRPEYTRGSSLTRRRFRRSCDIHWQSHNQGVVDVNVRHTHSDGIDSESNSLCQAR